jgi:hypothetical protein
VRFLTFCDVLGTNWPFSGRAESPIALGQLWVSVREFPTALANRGGKAAGQPPDVDRIPNRFGLPRVPGSLLSLSPDACSWPLFWPFPIWAYGR